MAVVMTIIVFWDVAPCILVDIYERLEQRPFSIFRMGESGMFHNETSVDTYQTTRRYILGDSNIHYTIHKSQPQDTSSS
jgi:hypothetical protein